MTLGFALGLMTVEMAAIAAPSARLVYVREPGAESCVDEEGLRKAVAARLGYDPFFAVAKVTVVTHVRREPSGAFHADVTLVDESGVARGARAIESESQECGPLVGALAIGISLALDPLSLTTPDKPADSPPVDKPPPDPPKETPVTPPPKADKPPAETPPQEPYSEPWRGWIGAAVTGNLGTTPGLSGGGLIRGKLARGPWSVGLEARVDAPTSTNTTTGGTISAWLAQGALFGCGQASYFQGCAVASIGPLIAESQSILSPRSTTLLYAAAGPRIGLEVKILPSLAVNAFGQALFAFAPRTLQIDGQDVFRQAILAPSFGVGLLGRIF
jgi:hypothetical protein